MEQSRNVGRQEKGKRGRNLCAVLFLQMVQGFLVVLHAFQGLIEVHFIVATVVKSWIGLNRCDCLERKE